MKRFAALLLALAMTLCMVPASLAADVTAKVTGDCVRVRVKPSLNADIYEQVNKGDKLTVLKEKNGWSKVLFTYSATGEELTGYVSSEFLKVQEDKTEKDKESKKDETSEKKEKKSEKKDKESKKDEKSEKKDKESKKDKKSETKRAVSMTADESAVAEQENAVLAAQSEDNSDTSAAGESAAASVSAEVAAAESSAPAEESAPAAEGSEEASAPAEESGKKAEETQSAPGTVQLPEEEEDEDPEISAKVSTTATVNEENINLRKEPSLEADILTKVPEGDIVIIRSEEDEEGWMKVLYYDGDGAKFKGYMLGEYLDINSIGIGRSNVPSVIIRQEPDPEADINGVVPKGKRVDVYTSKDGWYRIEYKDLSGWVQADCITVEGESDCEGYCRVTEDKLALREKPSKKSSKLEKIPEGIILQVTDKSEDGKWYAVTFNGHTGYVNRKYVEDVEQCDEGYVQTMASSLSLRTGAGSNFARMTTIPQGKVLPVSGTVGDWYEVKFGKFTGYVSGSFVSATTKDGFQAYPDYVEIVNDNVAVREEPTEDSNELETLPKGTLLAIQGIRDNWYQVTYNGVTGFVNSETAERGTEAADRAAEQAAAAIEAGGEAMTQSNGGGSSILSYAAQYIGNPYVWGGTSLTGGADCSGFVKSVLAHFGISVPHSSAAIRGYGRSVSTSEMQPGDIVCYSGHVGIYAGDGKLLSALGKKYGITYNSVHYKQILSVRRFT